MPSGQQEEWTGGSTDRRSAGENKGQRWRDFHTRTTQRRPGQGQPALGVILARSGSAGLGRPGEDRGVCRPAPRDPEDGLN